MPVDHLAWGAYQRRRWTRHDAERFWRPDAARFMTPEAARQLLPESMWPNEPPHRKSSSYDLKSDRSFLTELAADRAELLRLRSELAALRADLRFRQLLGKAYNPNQPRVPAGNPDGGQWTSGGVRPSRVKPSTSERNSLKISPGSRNTASIRQSRAGLSPQLSMMH